MRAGGVLSIALMETPARSLSNEFLPRLSYSRERGSTRWPIWMNFYVNQVNGFEMTSIFLWPSKLRNTYLITSWFSISEIGLDSLLGIWKSEIYFGTGNTSQVLTMHAPAGSQLSLEYLCSAPEKPTRIYRKLVFAFEISSSWNNSDHAYRLMREFVL